MKLEIKTTLCALLTSVAAFSHEEINLLSVEPSAPPSSYYDENMRAFDRHYLHAISYQYDLIELTDGSQWQVFPEDIDTLKKTVWYVDDPIKVSPNNPGIFSIGGGFYITNERTKEYIRAMIHMGPFENGPYSFAVSGIDHDAGRIILKRKGVLYNDSISFFLNPSEKDKYCKWIPGHTIIICSNDSWKCFFNGHQYLLLNVNLLSHAEAKKVK